MNKALFMKQIESYYGEYKNKVIKQFVLAYLDNYQEEKLNTLLKIIMENHPASFGAPDLAAIKGSHTTYAKETSGGDLKKVTENQKWVEVVELSKEEKVSAVEEHKKWLKSMADLSLIKSEKQIAPACKNCQFFNGPGAGEKPRFNDNLLISDRDLGKPHSFECMGCIDFSHFKKR